MAAKKGSHITAEHKAAISAASKGRVSPMKGKHHTAETKAKLSKSSKGRIVSAETKAKLSAAKKGKHSYTPTEETRAKLSAAHKGKPKSAESIAKRTATRNGLKPTAEAKAKISLALKGRKLPEDTKLKMSAAMKRRSNPMHDPENKAKISAAMSGRHLSKEHGAKIAAANKRRVVSLETRVKHAQHVLDGKTALYSYVKRPVYTNKCGHTIKFRSSWEYKVAVYLDEQNVNWGYEVCKLIFDDDVYIPDFFILDDADNIIMIIEVKGRYDQSTRDRFDKLKCESEIPIEVWDYTKLKELGIL